MLEQALGSTRKALLAAGLCGSLLSAPVFAASLNDAIVEVSETSYPILKSLQANSFVPFSEKVGKLILDIKPDKLGKAIELGIDVFVSVPPEKLDTFNGVVKEAFDGLTQESCTLVPLPASSFASQFASVAAEKVDPAKLKAFDESWGGTLKLLPRTETAICLPPVDKLDKLSLAQAEIGRSFGAEQSQRFSAYTTPLLKSSVSIGKVLPLLNDAKKLTPTASPKELTAFQAAGKRIEFASKEEARRVQLERASVKPSGARPAATQPTGTKNVVLEEEMAAARAAAAKEAAAKKQAAIEAAQRRKEELAEAEAVRVAELKAKAAAIKEAKEAARAGG